MAAQKAITELNFPSFILKALKTYYFLQQAAVLSHYKHLELTKNLTCPVGRPLSSFFHRDAKFILLFRPINDTAQTALRTLNKCLFTVYTSEDNLKGSFHNSLL